MNKTELYQPVIIKKEIDDEHFYYVDGKFSPAVTKILGETLPMPYALRQWIGEVGNDKAEQRLQQAGDRGTHLHDACERLLKGEEINLLNDFPKAADKKCLVAFSNWCAEYQPIIKGTEFTVASRSGYAGTLDILCEIEKELYIVDIKTSRSIYDSHKLQIAAYQNAYFEMSGLQTKPAILHLNPLTKKGYKFETELLIKNEPVKASDFFHVFALYKILNGGTIPEPPLVDKYPETIKLK